MKLLAGRKAGELLCNFIDANKASDGLLDVLLRGVRAKQLENSDYMSSEGFRDSLVEYVKSSPVDCPIKMMAKDDVSKKACVVALISGMAMQDGSK